jgi:hypothetical protein
MALDGYPVGIMEKTFTQHFGKMEHPKEIFQLHVYVQ